MSAIFLFSIVGSGNERDEDLCALCIVFARMCKERVMSSGRKTFKGNKTLARPWHRWANNIVIYIKETLC
jgi:hypothetical protein